MQHKVAAYIRKPTPRSEIHRLRSNDLNLSDVLDVLLTSINTANGIRESLKRTHNI